MSLPRRLPPPLRPVGSVHRVRPPRYSAGDARDRGDRRSGWRWALRLAGLLALGGCDIGEHWTADSAPDLLTGLSANDLRLCAGLPDRSVLGTGGAEFWSYERASSTGTGSVSLTQIGVSLASAEECRATFELRDGYVSRVAFTRVAGPPATHLASCAPLVETCSTMVREGRVTRVALPPVIPPVLPTPGSRSP